jgi:hypothetical protein
MMRVSRGDTGQLVEGPAHEDAIDVEPVTMRCSRSPATRPGGWTNVAESPTGAFGPERSASAKRSRWLRWTSNDETRSAARARSPRREVDGATPGERGDPRGLPPLLGVPRRPAENSTSGADRRVEMRRRTAWMVRRRRLRTRPALRAERHGVDPLPSVGSKRFIARPTRCSRRHPGHDSSGSRERAGHPRPREGTSAKPLDRAPRSYPPGAWGPCPVRIL